MKHLIVFMRWLMGEVPPVFFVLVNILAVVGILFLLTFTGSRVYVGLGNIGSGLGP